MSKNENLHKRMSANDEQSYSKRLANDKQSNKYIDINLVNALESVIYKNGGASNEDMIRWFNQGFTFCEYPKFGLKQCSGGPCGILAAIQAELIQYLFFEFYSDYIDDINNLDIDSEFVDIALAKAITSIILRVSSNNTVNVAIYNENDLLDNINNLNQCNLMIISCDNDDELFETIFNYLFKFKSPLGCIIVLLSIILTKGIDNIRNDMDIPTNTLIGQYGHCTQELINLLLTGVASSNVQDGNSSFDGSAELLKGIEKNPKIGYLTHLESLRLCQVGRYYKVPELPIWVVGSSSHFSVLFSQDRKCNEETKDEKMFYDLLRVFQLHDSDRCGFIASSALQTILSEIGLVDLCNNDIDLARLRGHLQVDGEIIIWSTFWVNISKLLSGESLDSLITIDFEKFAVDTNNEQVRFRSDSDVARELQAEYDNNQNNANLFKPINNNPINNKSNNSLKRERSDSDVARELQAKWSNEDNDNIYNLDFVQSEPDTAVKLQFNDEIANKQPETFNVTMYYFNGFSIAGRLPKLLKFIMKIRISTITIGVPVFSDNQEMLLGNNICPIEEVIRTRWPGATIDWLGNDLPSID
mmetsp:Transcript_13542/g.12259  ORF Transcript_13542/g.12259 Transcript_13542/m.12259 type:complete len:586 (-) Transcript_13542:550-2307(-)